MKCYQRVVGIESQNAIAWGNISMLQKMKGNISLAFEAIKQAVKHQESNWAMWYNYVIISFETMNFAEFIRGCLKLLMLGRQDALKDYIIEKLNVIVEEEFAQKKQNGQINALEIVVKNIRKIFQLLGELKPQDEFVWTEYWKFISVEIQIASFKLEYQKDHSLTLIEPIEDLGKFLNEKRALQLTCFEKRAYCHMQSEWKLNAQKREAVQKIYLEAMQFLVEWKDQVPNFQEEKTKLEL